MSIETEQVAASRAFKENNTTVYRGYEIRDYRAEDMGVHIFPIGSTWSALNEFKTIQAAINHINEEIHA